MEWLLNLVTSFAVSVGVIFGFSPSATIPPVPPTTQEETTEASSFKARENIVTASEGDIETSGSAGSSATALHPLISQALQNKRTIDVVPDCTDEPGACQVNVTKEAAIEKMIALKSVNNLNPASVTLRGGSSYVDPVSCSRGGGKLNQVGFFWTYSSWGFDGLIQVNVATGETGLCLWPLGDH